DHAWRRGRAACRAKAATSAGREVGAGRPSRLTTGVAACGHLEVDYSSSFEPPRASFSTKRGRWPEGPDGVQKAGMLDDRADVRAIRPRVEAAGRTPSGASRHLPQQSWGRNAPGFRDV